MKKVTPKYDGIRWRIRVTKDKKTYSFTSRKPGREGKNECLQKYYDWMDGIDNTRYTIEQVWEKFLDYYRTKNGESEQYRKITTYGRLYILPVIGSRIASVLVVDDFQQVIDQARPSSNSKRESLSKKSLSNIREVLNQFIKYSVARDYIPPLKDSLYIPHGATTKEKVIMQPDEITKLFSEDLDNHWYINYFRFAVVTGLRPGEIIGLKKSDVNMMTRLVTIRRSINVRNEITDGKNANAQREFILSSLAFDILQKQLERTEYLKTEWVFPDQDGGHAKERALYQNWKRVIKLPGSPYTLRHTFVSMVKYDVPLEMIKAIVGHSAAMDTIGTYGHRVTGELEQTAALIDESLKKKISNK